MDDQAGLMLKNITWMECEIGMKQAMVSGMFVCLFVYMGT